MRNDTTRLQAGGGIVYDSKPTDEYVETMNKLATCISENLIDLADDPDTNANWQMVFELEEEGMQSNWDYFEVVEN